MVLEEERFILEKRRNFLKNDSFKEERKRWLSKLCLKYDSQEINTFEMYHYKEEVLKFNYNNPPNYWKDYMFNNTRIKLLSETRAEMDKIPLEKAISLTWTIAKNLIKGGFHFAIFYAEGGRSPHTIIYDFEELRELNPYQRERAQLEFWRSIIPFDIQHLDKSLWGDNHPVPLEFAPHWKHEKPFQLCYEYVPKPKLIKIERKPKKKIVYVKSIKKEESSFHKTCPKCGFISYKTIGGDYICTNNDCLYKEEVQKCKK